MMRQTKHAKKLRDGYKDYFIPNLKVIHEGKEIPVISTLQSHYEWSCEHERAQRFYKLAMIELAVIMALIISMILK